MESGYAVMICLIPYNLLLAAWALGSDYLALALPVHLKQGFKRIKLFVSKLATHSRAFVSQECGALH